MVILDIPQCGENKIKKIHMYELGGEAPQNVINMYCYDYFRSFMQVVFCYLSVAHSLGFQILS